ncbi:MAG: helix-turn-helix domain-containing protein [Sulfurospirillaceae bacterium]|nr:helix-turn-helix domain-containing protein [Sulfurospirillaceae bacterium]MDD3463464.1 helix-turn-helix domain-containing protein [Sulfurospirillaceae bacterium]
MRVVKRINLPKETILKTSEDFGKLIISRRTSLGLTQKMTAQLCNINTQTLAKIEKGNELVGLNNSLKVATNLGIKILFSIEE